MIEITQNKTILELQKDLDQHSVYATVQSIEDLRIFMEHHIFSVWDFMSLVKYLQASIVPTHYPWQPPYDAQVGRFINEIVLEEESDEMPDGKSFLSHYEMYRLAMTEVGANTTAIDGFLATVKDKGIHEALQSCDIPQASRTFTQSTFSFIDASKPHNVAAAFALGRENIIPVMFKALLKKIGISKKEAPTFHYYLERHIHLDEGFHGPLSMRLLEQMCGGDDGKIEEANQSAINALQARIAFWDGVLERIKR
ncbi:MAG: DUF3050 domain-containing protein [Campylobacterota bacterium]|nr:DUF3050 domain-containing protein [Campylobacterota bacterium]